MNPPPPILPAAGYVTANANPVAIAASTALPPDASTCAPASLAIALADTTMPFDMSLPRVATDDAVADALVPTFLGEQADGRMNAARRDASVAVRRTSPVDMREDGTMRTGMAGRRQEGSPGTVTAKSRLKPPLAQGAATP